VENFDFSFSGLKTAVLYFLKSEIAKEPDFIEKNKADLCASVQQTIVDILIDQVEAVARATGIKQLCLAGGVSANSQLRSRFEALGEKGYQTYIPKFEYCTDNAAMIGIAGYFSFKDQRFAGLDCVPKARMLL
jgi:N6-L-threonylcarbamoyladenine synthase